MKWCKAIIKCVILHVKRKKYYFSLFLPYFWFLIKYKMATMFGDVTDLPPHHSPSLYHGEDMTACTFRNVTDEKRHNV